MNRKELEAIWNEVHLDLPIERHSLTEAIITEGIESGGTDPEAISRGLYTLADDIERLANAVVERTQGLA